MTTPNIILPYEAFPLGGETSITVPIGFEADCSVAEQVGDPVVFSETIDKKVERITSNIYNNLVVGIINEKPTPTTCIVIVSGILDNVTTGLSRGKAIFVSTTGGLTTTKPATGHLQIIGMALSATGLNVNIGTEKVIQS